MSPADITATAEFRAGLARRLAELGLVPFEPAAPQPATIAGPSVVPTGEHRRAA